MNACPDCGFDIPEDAPLGLCPVCLVSVADDGDFVDLAAPDDHRIGGFRVVRQIGEGGFAIVYEAEQTEPVSRRVGLKLLKPNARSPQVLARFDAERQALALMDHPNIASIFDAGETEEGDPFFVMEYVDGEAIHEYCARRNLATNERLAILRNVCEAVQHAHLKGVIHRDIKPSNVLVTEIDGRSVPKVIDFGIARALDVSLTNKVLFTELHQIVGTPSYMSPEQAALDGLPLDGRSDIYSLGILIYETLTGERPYSRREGDTGSIPELLRRVIHEDPIPLSRHDSSLKGEIEWVVSKAIAKRPEDRYDSAGSLARELERVVENRPVEAAAPSNWYRVRKFARRHRGSVIAGTLAVVAMIAGTAVSIVQNLHATRLSEDLQVREVELRHEFRNSDFRMGLQLAARRRPGDAIAHFCRALRTDPDHDPSASCLLALLMNQKFTKMIYPVMEYPDSIERCRLPTVFEEGQTVVGLVDEPEQLAKWEFETGTFASFPTGMDQPVQFLIPLAFESRFAWAAGKIVEIRTSQDPAIPIHRFELDAPVTCLINSPKSAELLAGCEDGKIKSWNVETGEISGQRELSSSPITALAVGRGGTRVGYGTASGEVGIWLVGIDDQEKKTDTHQSRITAVAVPESGSHLVSGDESGNVHIWRGPRLIPVAGPIYHGGAVRVLMVNSANRRIMSGSADGYARLWNMSDGALLPPAQVHRSPVTFGALASSAGQFITGGQGGSLRLWSAKDGSGEAFPGAAQTSAAAVSSSRHLLATFSDRRRQIGLYEIDREPIWLRRLDPGDGIDHGESFGNPCPDHLQSDKGNVEVHLASSHSLHNTGSMGDEILMRASSPIVSWSLRPDGKQVAVLTEGGKIELWDPHTGEELAPPLRLDFTDVVAIRFPEPAGQIELLLGDGELARMDIPPPHPRLPPWFLNFAEELGGKRLTENGEIRNLGENSLDTVVKNLPDSESSPLEKDNAAWRFVRWFFADRGKRTAGPSQEMIVGDYVKQLLDTETPKYIQEALRLDPGNQRGIELLKQNADLAPRR